MELTIQNLNAFDELLNSSERFTINPDVLFRQLEGEGVILDPGSGNYYNLNEISLKFWLAIGEAKPLQPVVNQVLAEYEVDQAQVLIDLQGLIDCLVKNQLLLPKKNTD